MKKIKKLIKRYLKLIKHRYLKLIKHKKKVVNTCFLLSLLFVSIMYLLIGIYQTHIDDPQQHCLLISSLIMAIWYLRFPKATDAKEKMTYHMIWFLVELVIYCLVLIYWINNISASNWILDILIAVILSIAIAHTFYVFYKFYFFINQVLKKLNTENNKFMLFIKTVTSIILTITAFFTAIIGLSTILYQFVTPLLKIIK